jgi:L-ribulose-5-phosphate 3-epimerase
MLQFGLRAHDFGRFPAEILAERLGAFQPASIQLALAKAFPDTPANSGFLNPGYARRIRDIFADRGIAIAVLGCYINPVHPDPDELERQLRSFEEHLRFARDFGCAVVGTETGSLNPDCSYHPETQSDETFNRLCDSIGRLVRIAERCGSIIGIEPVADQHTISSIEKTRALIERIGSPTLGIIFDPVNLIPESGLQESQPEFFKRAFEAFGRSIVAVHVKDFHLEKGKKLGALVAGTGIFDFDSFFRLLQTEKPCIDVLLENASPATAPAALEQLVRIAARTAWTCSL